jgi:hypothetical protein
MSKQRTLEFDPLEIVERMMMMQSHVRVTRWDAAAGKLRAAAYLRAALSALNTWFDDSCPAEIFKSIEESLSGSTRGKITP